MISEHEKSILRARLFPQPRKMEFPEADGFFRIADGAVFRISGTEQDADNLRRVCRMFWNCDISLEMIDLNQEMPAEGYRVQIAADGVTIQAADHAGALNALKTLRQMAEEERGVEKYSGFELEFCTVEDAPQVAFRGLHLCWFPENHVWQLERAVRLAASLKYNYIVLETWGVFPFESHPQLCWEEYGVKRADLRRIIDTAKLLGVTMIPQFNLLGHASGSRENGGKHVVLNRYPEYAPLFEPDGWSWCISNPETRRWLTDAVLEMYDFFGAPGFFHAGCDEARLIGTCRNCRKQELYTLVKDHLLYFCDLLKQRGARMMMWHDMLLNKEDTRWDGYIVCGSEAEGLSKLLDVLPKDVILCDWQYGYPEKDGNPPTWETSKFLKANGFNVVVSPCGDLRGTRSLAEAVKSMPLDGLLETTWSDLDRGMQNTLFKTACAAWHGGEPEYLGEKFLHNWDADGMCQMHRLLRQVANDMGLREYESTGRIMLQTPEKVYF